MTVKVPIFARPTNWHRWARWAAQWCGRYSEIGQVLGVDRWEVWHYLEKDPKLVPLGEREYVPVVWTEWGWLEGEFDETGVFRYACDEAKWESQTGAKG